MDHRARNAALRGGLVGQQRLNGIRLEHILVALVDVQHEFIAAREIRTGERDARPVRIGKHFGVRQRRRRVFKIDDEPALAEGRSAQGNAKLATDTAAGAVAGDKIAAPDLALATFAVNAQYHNCRLV